MLKTALRVSLQFHEQPVALLESADRVLPAVKEPDMYATLAMLYFDGSTQAEYALAGHGRPCWWSWNSYVTHESYANNHRSDEI